MLATAKRPPTATLVPNSALEQATLALQSLPEKPREEWPMREAVDQLRDSITDALGKGYGYEEVAEMLSEQGVQISPSSLKYYLTRVKKNDKTSSRSRTSTRAPRRSRTAEEVTPLVTTPPLPAPKATAAKATTPVGKNAPSTKSAGSRSKPVARKTSETSTTPPSTKASRSSQTPSKTKAKPAAEKPQAPSKSTSKASKKPGSTRRKKTA